MSQQTYIEAVKRLLGLGVSSQEIAKHVPKLAIGMVCLVRDRPGQDPTLLFVGIDTKTDVAFEYLFM